MVLAAGAASGADNMTANQMNSDPQVSYDQHPDNLYHANELSLDLFGTDALDRYTTEHPSENRVRHDSRLGAGIGLNYFFLRYIGVGADAWTENTAHNFVDNVSGSLILRLPFEPLGLAPYAFGGGGHQFDPSVASFVHGGAGLEWRFVKHVGIFADGRYVWTDRTRNYSLFRAGVRLSF